MNEANRKAFLDMIAVSELLKPVIEQSDNGYNVLVGSTPGRVMMFDSYADHPRKVIEITLKDGTIIKSTAAGRYQLLARFFDHYKKLLKLGDFSPPSQDEIAIQQIKESRALNDVDQGFIDNAIRKCAHIWASFPGANYGQPEQKLADLRAAFKAAGGTIA